jgi:hypothetical protein
VKRSTKASTSAHGSARRIPAPIKIRFFKPTRTRERRDYFATGVALPFLFPQEFTRAPRI